MNTEILAELKAIGLWLQRIELQLSGSRSIGESGTTPKGGRDTSLSVTLRTREVFDLYGIKQPTLSRWCSEGLVKSSKVGSRGGRRGTLLVYRESLEAYLSAGGEKK